MLLAYRQDVSFISAEISTAEATRWATALDSAKGFEPSYSRFRDWSRSAKSFAPLAQKTEHLVLREDSFTEIDAWNPAAGPNELNFLAATSIAHLVEADSHLPDEPFQPRCIARAFLLMGSKTVRQRGMMNRPRCVAQRATHRHSSDRLAQHFTYFGGFVLLFCLNDAGRSSANTLSHARL